MTTKDREKEVPEKLQRQVRSVLLSSPKGVQLRKFCSEYRSLAKEPFPWKQLGYSSVANLLKAMPAVVRFEFSPQHEDYCLYGIVDQSCFLPSWLKKYKGENLSSVSTPPSKHHRPPSSSKKPPSPKKKTLPKWKQNLVSVHVSFKHRNSTMTDDTKSTVAMMRKQLPDVMKGCGTPKDVYIDDRGFAFVRYATLTEAQEAMRMYSNTYIGKTEIIVRPSKESKELFTKFKEGGVTRRSRDYTRTRPQGEKIIREAGKSEGSSCELSEPGNGERGTIRWDGNCTRPVESQAEEQSTLATACEDETSVECSHRVQSSQSILVDAISPPHNYHKSHVGSDNESDLDSDFWDEELLSSAMEQVTIPYSDVCMPPPPDQKSEWYSLQLSQRSTPNEHGLTPVYVSLVESPSLVWLQLTSDPKCDISNLSKWIAQLCPPRLTQVQEGMICCVMVVSEGYRRVQVDHLDNCVTRQQASVVFIDTGLSQMVACSQLYSLPPALSLLNVPPLALPCRLGGVQSTFAGGTWYFLDNQQLWKHLMEKKVYVRKVPQSLPLSTPHTGLPQVAVDIFLDDAGKDSVANLLILTGMHVVSDDENSECCSGNVEWSTNTAREQATISHSDVMKGGTSGFQMITKTVHVTRVGPHMDESGKESDCTSSTIHNDGFTDNSLCKVEEGELDGSSQPDNSCPQSFSPLPAMQSSIVASPSPHSRHTSPLPSVLKTNSPFQKLQKLIDTLHT